MMKPLSHLSQAYYVILQVRKQGEFNTMSWIMINQLHSIFKPILEPMI